MRRRPIKNLQQRLEQISYLLSLTDLEYFAGIFEQSQPLFIEIGMGKGNFLKTLSGRHPEYNFLGVDRKEGVLMQSGEKISPRPNLKLVWGDFYDVQSYIPDNAVRGIYLNFPDPWPKKRHHKWRLTHQRFVTHYVRILEPGGCFQFKTDNPAFWEYSLEQFRALGYAPIDISDDIHQDPRYADNVWTEYEHKYAQLGRTTLAFRYRKI